MPVFPFNKNYWEDMVDTAIPSKNINARALGYMAGKFMGAGDPQTGMFPAPLAPAAIPNLWHGNASFFDDIAKRMRGFGLGVGMMGPGRIHTTPDKEYAIQAAYGSVARSMRKNPEGGPYNPYLYKMTAHPTKTPDQYDYLNFLMKYPQWAANRIARTPEAIGRGFNPEFLMSHTPQSAIPKMLPKMGSENYMNMMNKAGISGLYYPNVSGKITKEMMHDPEKVKEFLHYSPDLDINSVTLLGGR